MAGLYSFGLVKSDLKAVDRQSGPFCCLLQLFRALSERRLCELCVMPGQRFLSPSQLYFQHLSLRDLFHRLAVRQVRLISVEAVNDK